MNKLLEIINANHALNIKKEDFNSFKLIKPYFDKFLTIIITDSPILVHNLESPDKYLNENGIYPYLPTFYESFQLSDDGYDHVEVIKIARYCSLMQYILDKIDSSSKIKFNFKDVVEPKFSRLVSFLSKLSLFAKFVLATKDTYHQVLRDCEKEKEENDKVLRDCEKEKEENDKVIYEINLREQIALQKNVNHHELLQKFQALSATSKTTKQKLENQSQILKDKIADNEEINFKISKAKESLELVRENKRKGLEKKNSLQAYMVKNPEQLDEELGKLEKETLDESEKEKVIYQKNVGLKKLSNEYLTISLKIPLLSNHLNLINGALENYEILDNEIQTMAKPEIEINNCLVIKREKIIKEIEINSERNQLRLENINKMKSEIKGFEEDIGNFKRELKILERNQRETRKQLKHKEDEVLQINASFKQTNDKYINKMREIERNVEQSLNELKNIYSLKR